MSRTATVVAIGLAVAGAAMAVLLWGNSGPQPGSARIARAKEKQRLEVFVAGFDSLTDARLYPTVWRSGTFTKTTFDDNREEWTLTVSPEDWRLRDEASKRDLAATLFSAFQGARAQAGGDPDRAILLIENKEGEVLLSVSMESGITVRK
jgi:hypothetical protein